MVLFVAPSPNIPFVEYVLKALEHPPYMFIGKLAACCTILFLNRSDPDLLRELCVKWAIRFRMDREKLIRQMEERVLAENRIISNSKKHHETHLVYQTANSERKDDAIAVDTDVTVEHFLSLLNSLVPSYFSWNWHRTDYVIQINKEYEALIMQSVLPLCASVSAEEGVDDPVSSGSLISMDSLAHLYQSPVATGRRLSYSVLSLEGRAGSSSDNGALNDDSLRSRSQNSHVSVPDSITLVTLENFKEFMLSNTTGLVLIFHAKYSQNSVHVVEVFTEIVQGNMLDPMPKVGVIYVVTEPELTGLYKTTWFPTVVYTPPPCSDSAIAQEASTSHASVAERSGGTSTDCGSVVRSPVSQTELSSNSQGPATSRRSLISGVFVPDPTPTGPPMPAPTEVLYGVKVQRVLSPVTNGLPTSMVSVVDGKVTDAKPIEPVDAGNVNTDIAFDPEAEKQEHEKQQQQKDANCLEHGTTSLGNVDDVTLLNSDDNDEDEEDGMLYDAESVNELHRLIADDDHCVYPMLGPCDRQSFIDWIQSKGALRIQNVDGFVTKCDALTEKQKYKTKMETCPAIERLRRMQMPTLAPNSCIEDEPQFIFLGGGMAAGKSTAAASLAQSEWWKKHKEHSILIDADSFKIDNAHFGVPPKEIHELSVRTAENVLVQAINQGRSIVFDGTMMWAPFVRQTIDMVRNAHTHLYRQGRGFVPEENVEEYFVQIDQRPVPLPKPYHIHVIGITVSPETAVPRGFLRKFSIGRGVPIANQLKSFKLFSENFADYVELVDSAVLLNNNVFVDLESGELPPVLAERKDSDSALVIYDEEAYAQFQKQRQLNTEADNIFQLYSMPATANASRTSISSLTSPIGTPNTRYPLGHGLRGCKGRRLAKKLEAKI